MPRFYKRPAAALAGAALMIIPIAACAAADFDQIDTNANGVINFSEFAAFAITQDQSPSQAAQTFINLAQDDVLITRSEYRQGVRLFGHPRWDQDVAMTPLTPDVETMFDVPALPFGRVVNITPNEEVAGEVIHAFEAEYWDDDVMATDVIMRDEIKDPDVKADTRL